MTRLVVGSATDIGLVRSNNQDQLLVAPGLYAVADGMGGHAAGEVASLTAIKALDAAFEASDQRTAASLESAAKAANRAVWEQARTNREMLGMGTTLVALAVVENDDGTSGLAVAHIGDSRLYLYRDKALSQVTVDHSLVQELIDEGQINQAQAAVHPQRHVLTRALGVEPAVDVDVIQIAPENNDRYLLCSDGLPREASDDQIAAILSRFPDPSEAAKELVELANSRGGSDNVTVVVVDVQSNEQSPDTLIIVPGPATSAGPESSGTQIADKPPADGGNGSEAGPPEASKAVASHSRPARNGSPNRLNLRVVGFVVALCLVIGAAIASVAWYARSSYFVGLAGGRIAIFQGRPGGVLWFQPTLSDRTTYSSGSVLSYNLEALKSGQLEPSLGQAHQYVSNLVAEKREAELADRPPPRGGPSTTAHVPTTVRVPTTSRPPVSTVRTSPSTAPATPSTQTASTHTPSTLAHTPSTGHGAPTTRAHTTTHVVTTTHTGTTHTASTHTASTHTASTHTASTHTASTRHPATTTRTVPAAHPGTTKRPATTTPTSSTHPRSTSSPSGSGHATTTTVAKARTSS